MLWLSPQRALSPHKQVRGRLLLLSLSANEQRRRDGLCMHTRTDGCFALHGMGLILKPCKAAGTHGVVTSVCTGGTSSEVSAEAPAQAGSSSEEEAAAPAGPHSASKAQRGRRRSGAGMPQGQSSSAPATMSGALAQSQEAPGVAIRP